MKSLNRKTAIMKRFSTILITLITAFCFQGSSFAQCASPTDIVKTPKDKLDYNVSSQSRSGVLIPGENYEMSFIAQDGMDYRISAGAKNKDAGSVSFEVYEMVVQKTEKDGQTVYKKIKKVIATSADGETEPVEFTTDKARKIVVKVNVMGGDPKTKQCIGVLIEDKKTIKIGL
jgi:hypothetical protein